MADYTTSLDIANRACQHMGCSRISSFTEDSVQASELDFAYDKVRMAELRRNTWRFAIRRAVLRPIDSDTQLLTPAAWSDATTYAIGAIVSYSGKVWSSTIPSNLAHIPGVTGWQIYFGSLLVQPHDATLAYYPGDIVSVSTTAYLSLIGSNDDTPPTANWLTLGGTLADFALVYPIGSGPSSQTLTRNVYQLPSGFLREAPADPKAGSTSFLGAPSGVMYNDWTFEGDYFTTRDSEPIVFRFVADVEDVTQMDPMFCEGLGARLGMECCQRVTQSSAKHDEISKVYLKFMTEARIVNGIETGPVEPPEDDWITCRL